MEHHLSWDKGWLQKLQTEPQFKVTLETEVTSVTRLAEGSMSMKDVINAWKQETPLQMQVGHTI